MSPLGKGPIWLSILAETFWPVQTFEINMHHAFRGAFSYAALVRYG
jgi:hypothetical protein